MKFIKIQNKISWSLITVLLLGVAFVGIWHVSADKTDKEQFHKRLQDGVGKEVLLAKSGDSPEVIQNSVESLSQFIEYRSGVKLSNSVKDRLVKLETETLTSQQKQLTASELSEVLLDVLFERTETSTSEEIERAAETLRGFDYPDLPQEYKNGRKFVKLRANEPTKVTPSEVVEHINKIKTANAQSKSAYRLMASRVVGEQVAGRAVSLQDSLPEKYNSATTNLSPVQSVLITYSVASDDNLLDSANNLKRKMKSIEKWVNKKYKGKHYPNAEEYRAYGPNGYLYSSPVDILLDERTMNRLLDKIHEKGEVK